MNACVFVRRSSLFFCFHCQRESSHETSSLTNHPSSLSNRSSPRPSHACRSNGPRLRRESTRYHLPCPQFHPPSPPRRLPSRYLYPPYRPCQLPHRTSSSQHIEVQPTVPPQHLVPHHPRCRPERASTASAAERPNGTLLYARYITSSQPS